MFSTKINAIIIVIWAGIRYLIIKAFWPLFRPKAHEKVKLYYNGDIIAFLKDGVEAVVTKGGKLHLLDLI